MESRARDHRPRSRSRPVRVLFNVAGIVALGLGLVGIFLPLLPTTPFVLLAAACFARGSERFHQWLLANRTSPDLSHRVQVCEGDTLPLLCHRIYGDASYYPEVARFNRLQGFRHLPAGLQLDFPPLA